MKLRLCLLPTLALLALATPALAQYPGNVPQAMPQPKQSPQAPQAPAAATPAPAAATAAPAPAAAPATAMPIPQPTCVGPKYPGKSGSNAAVIQFNKDYKAYSECIKKFVDENRAWAKAVIDNDNKIVDEYNKYTEDLRKEIDAAKE